MKVILKENMDNLGYIGDVVEVNKGYARNYLFPRGLAVEYTNGNLKSMEYLKQKEWEKRNREILEAKALADKINDLNIVFKAKSGKDGKLFGSITNKDIAQYLLDNYQVEIDRKKIEHDDAMKNIGDYPIVIRLHKEVNARLNVIISPEEDSKKDESLSNEEIKEKAEE